MKKLIIIAGSLLVLAGCYNDKYDKLYPTPTVATVTCDTTTISYAKDIVPILTANCNIAGGCHDADGANTSGYDFSTYKGIHSLATHDILLNDINGTPSPGFNAMPKNLPKMAQCDIDKMTRWVNQGSQNN